MEKSTIAWITATALILIAVGSYTLELESKSLDLKLADGKVLFSYKEGIAKFYSGRYLASKDWIKPFYWNGAYYAQMYKKRGDKYSNLSYYKDGDITYIKQIILYSRGNLTRYFEISEYDVKESFEFIPNDLTLRTYFKWNYDGLDLGRKEVYLDGKKKETQAVMDFDIINDWSKEIDNIKRAERFLNGRMTIRTRVFEGVATFDPKIIIDDGIKNNPGDTIKWGFGVNDEYLDPIWYGEKEIHWKDNCNVRCEGDTCNTIIGRTEWVNDTDDQCKHIKKAKSLKNHYNVIYLKDDGDHKIEVIDFNYTSITFNLRFIGNVADYEYEVKEGKIKTKFKVGNDEYEIEIEEGKDKTYRYKGEVFGNNFSLGLSSTTIQLQDADVENLQDAYVDSENFNLDTGGFPVVNVGNSSSGRVWLPMFMFNISSIPENITIDEAQLCLNIEDQHLDAGESVRARLHHVFSFPNYNISGNVWDEDIIRWPTRPNTTLSLNFTADSNRLLNNSFQADDWVCWIATTTVNVGYTEEDDNVSIIIISTLESGSPSTSDFVQFYTKEEGTSSIRPYLNITLVDIIPPIALNVINISTTNVSILWEATFDEAVNMTGTAGLFPSYTDIGIFSNSTKANSLRNLTEGLLNNTRYGWNITSFCDTSGNCNESGFNFTFITSQYVIITKPFPSNNQTNNTDAGESTLFSVLWEDISGLSSYIFSWHDGANWSQVNNSGDKESGEQSQIGTEAGEGLFIFDSFETNFTGAWIDDGIVEAWTRKTDGTTSSNTGPQPQGSAQGADGAYFIYVETSSAECNTNGETAITLTTDSIDFDAGINDQITWYNSMYGADIGTLLLQENTTGSWNTLWTMSGDQGSSPVWFQNITDLSALEGIGHLRFHYTCAGGFTGDAAIDAINITSEAASSNEVNKTAIEYLNVLNEDIYFNIDNITVTVQVSYYNTSGSIANNNLNATLWLEVYNGTSWIDEGDFGVGTIQAVQNYSILVTTPSVLNGWGILSNRDIRISARLMDFNDSNTFDTINWTGVWSIVGSNQEFLNDSSVDFTGIINTSNVTKTITSTVGATIKWQVFANNTNNLFNQTDIFQFVTTGGVVDSDPPIITLLSPDNETTNTTSRVIDFLYNVTDESSISSCELIINGSNNKTVTSPAKNTTNNITQFLNNGNYTWQVNCTDSSTNEGNSSIRNINTNVDIIPPTFIQAPLNFSTFNESSGVNWSSNELTNFTLTYGICPSFSGSTINNNTFRLNQSQNLTSLTNNTNYCVNVSIWDSSSNTNSSFFNFTTQQYTPPDETAPTFIQEPNNFSTFNASSGVNWSNNELANFTLTYGVCPTFTETTINNNTFRFNQSQNLTSLINNTNYCVNVTVWDNSSNRNESNFNFTTQQYTPPDEKAPTFVQLPLNFSTFNASSGVNWSSNELANFSLTYGTCPTFTGTTINNNTFRFNQSQNLTGLNNNTNYCVNVTIWDSSSNRNDSSFNFTTQPYNLSIVILNLASSSVTNQSAIVSWDCSKACNYSIKVYNNSVRNTTNLINSTDNNSFATSHVFPLTQLINFTTYFVNLTVFDSISNSTENNSLNFTTSQYIVTQGAITFLALPTNHTTKATTTFVNWSTDPAGNYTLTYGTCPSFLGITSVRTDFETSRNVQLINLLRNTTYCVNVSVADSNTNKNSSSFNFTTLDVDYLRLDGLEENRTYEYETTVNITSSLNYFTIYDDTNRYINRRLTSCYQEFANVSTPCGGLDSGAYSISASSGVGNPAWYDGNFSTQSNSGVAWTFRINYTVPNGTVSADWRVKDGFQLNSTTDERILRVNDTCFNVSGKIILEIARNGGGEPINYSCRNASNDLIQVDSKWLGFLFYEEAIWWNYESQPNLLDRFNYLIDILRVNTTSANVVNGSSYNVSIDADSDLYNASFNITGNGNVGNLSINYTQFIYFPGLLIGHNLYQNEFIFGSNRFTTRNISFLSAETKTIFINYSAEGNPDTRQGFWNFTITAFDSDANNEMTFLAQFNQTNTTNDILNGTWHPIGDMGGFNNTFFTFSNNASNSFWKGFISWRKDQSTCDEAGNLGGDDTCISTSGGVAQLNKRMYNEHTDLSLVNYFTTQIIMRCHCNCESRLEFYDLTNTVLIENVQQLGCPFDNTFVRDSCNITGTRTPGTEIWKIVTSGSGCTDKSVSVAGLTTPYYISLNNPTGSDSSTAYTYVNVFKNFNIGGIYLNKSYNRTSGIEGAAAATHSGNFTTHLINTTTDDIVRATLSYNQIITENHNITAYLSNDDGATFEEIVNNSAHTFFSVGNQIRARFEMFSNVNWSNPIVTEYTVSIESAPMSSLIVDIGADDNFDFDFDFELNSSTTPIYLDNDSSINNYIENSCENQSFCLIPIEFASGSAGTLQLNELNLTENINPIRINTTAVQDLSEIKHYVIFHQGTSVTFDDVRYDYRGNKNITIEAHTADHSSAINRTIEVVYSVFNLSFPPNVNFWEVFFDFRNQTLKAPFGQNSSDGIWKVDNLADHDKGIDLYTRWNQSVNSCLLEDRFVGYNNNNDSSFNISLSTTGQRIIQNITTETNDIFAYSTINCSASVNVVITPFFCFYSMCSECVFTSDAHESECLIQ